MPHRHRPRIRQNTTADSSRVSIQQAGWQRLRRPSRIAMASWVVRMEPVSRGCHPTVLILSDTSKLPSPSAPHTRHTHMPLLHCCAADMSNKCDQCMSCECDDNCDCIDNPPPTDNKCDQCNFCKCDDNCDCIDNSPPSDNKCDQCNFCKCDDNCDCIGDGGNTMSGARTRCTTLTVDAPECSACCDADSTAVLIAP